MLFSVITAKSIIV